MPAEIHDAPRELLALATAMREDWKTEETWNALLACKHANWDFERILKRTVALACRDDSEPRELLDEARATRTAPPGSLPEGLRAKAIADSNAAAERLRQQGRDRGNAA